VDFFFPGTGWIGASVSFVFSALALAVATVAPTHGCGTVYFAITAVHTLILIILKLCSLLGSLLFRICTLDIAVLFQKIWHQEIINFSGKKVVL